MKKLILLLLALQFVLLCAFVSSAQHQRLGIGPGTVTLNRQKPSSEVEAFCLDRNLIIDGTYNYNHVLSPSKATVTVGGKTLPLQKAIQDRLIRIESMVGGDRFGSGIGIRFVSLTRAPVTVRIPDSMALGENPGTYTNGSALAVLKTARKTPRLSSRDIQDSVWEADVDRVREALGYKSLEEFQQANNLPVDGLSLATKAKLEELESELIARFEAVGIRSRRYDTRVQSVYDNIREFQQRMSIKPTGVYSPDVRTAFETYERVDFPAIKSVSQYRSPGYNYLFLKVTASGDSSFYKVYGPGSKLYEGNSVAEIRTMISNLAQYGKTYVELDFPSKNQTDAFKTSFDIQGINSNIALIETSTAFKNVYFSNSRSFDVGAISEPVLQGSDYVSTIDFKSTSAAEVDKSWKLRAAAGIKQTVTKFTDAFKNLAGRKERQSLADIVERARRIEADRTQTLDVKVSLIGEFGEIRVAEISLSKLLQIAAE